MIYIYIYMYNSSKRFRHFSRMGFVNEVRFNFEGPASLSR